MATVAEYAITQADLRNLLGGEGGVDLERVIEHGQQVAMRIVGIQPGTTADRLGARNGDTIVAINAIPLRSIAEAYRAADLGVARGELTITGTRDGAPYVTVLKLVS